MADETKPDPKVRVRFVNPVTVDGVTYPADTYEVEVIESDADVLEAVRRVTRVDQDAAALPAQVAAQLTPEQVAAVAAALTQPQPPPGSPPVEPST